MESLQPIVRPAQQCCLCHKIGDFLDHGPYDYHRRLLHVGTWNDLRGNIDCPTCSRIVDLFETEAGDGNWQPPTGSYQYRVEYTSCPKLELSSDFTSRRYNLCVDLAPVLGQGPSEIQQRAEVILHPSWVGVNRTLKWIRECDTNHPDCHTPLSTFESFSRWSDMYLIDVNKGCLVRAAAKDTYVALSYVWGSQPPMLRTLKTHLPSLLADGSLFSRELQHKLPGTVQRAMRLTSMLNVKYLWADCLCIVQDDLDHLNSQINSMASIYSNSYLTLCAADGEDADGGLRGVPDSSLPRELHQDILSFECRTEALQWIVVPRRKPHTWEQRGWTFQEMALSRRCLIFRNIGLSWRCHEYFAEEARPETEPYYDQSSLLGEKKILHSDALWPCLTKWNELLSQYLRLKLSYEQDILRAFSGIQEALRRSLHHGFHYGLPEQFFDVALLWIAEEPLVRREIPQAGKAMSSCPSWSWAGWKGALTSQVHGFGLDYERICSSEMWFTDEWCTPATSDRLIYPCITWYKTASDTLEKCEIANDYAKYRSQGLAGDMVLPPGWSSVPGDQLDSRSYYKYEFAPSNHSFWYPIPTHRANSPIPPDRDWSPLLYFEAERSYLELGNAIPRRRTFARLGNRNDTCLPMQCLSNSSGTWAGVIFAHEHPGSHRETSEQCELIRISGGVAAEVVNDGVVPQVEYLPEWNHPQRPRSGDVYHFYHVLWIEWHDGIAYRKGLGRVAKSVWDGLQREEIEVYLG